LARQKNYAGRAGKTREDAGKIRCDAGKSGRQAVKTRPDPGNNQPDPVKPGCHPAKNRPKTSSVCRADGIFATRRIFDLLDSIFWMLNSSLHARLLFLTTDRQTLAHTFHLSNRHASFEMLPSPKQGIYFDVLSLFY